MPSDKIRVGIIGANPNYGWSGRAHFPALLNLPEFQVVALCTTQPETAGEAAKHFGIPLAFHNYTDLIAHPDIDVVSVSVRVPFHRAMVLAAWIWLKTALWVLNHAAFMKHRAAQSCIMRTAI